MSSYRSVGPKSQSENTKYTASGSMNTFTISTEHTLINQTKPLTGHDLVTVVKSVIDRSIIQLSTLKQSLQLKHYKVDDAAVSGYPVSVTVSRACSMLLIYM